MTSLRPDSKELIEKLQKLGISVKMLTGDALPIAKEIAKDVGLGEKVMRAADLKERIKEDVMEAQEAAEKSDVFAEVYPEDKYAIVKSLQVRKHVLGMTGDGVNDAPGFAAGRSGNSSEQRHRCRKGRGKRRLGQ